MPISRQVRITRTAISPRLATRIFWNMALLLRPPARLYTRVANECDVSRTLICSLTLRRGGHRISRPVRLPMRMLYFEGTGHYSQPGAGWLVSAENEGQPPSVQARNESWTRDRGWTFE